MKALKQNKNPKDSGTQVILPSTCREGPRYVSGLKHDALAVARHFKGMSCFLTLTMNANCPKVKRKIDETKAKPTERPDIITRVWEQKKQLMLDMVLKGNVFGKVIGYC